MESRSRYWVFTDFQTSKQHYSKWLKLAEDDDNTCTYVCFGIEVAPTTGKKHLQGYVEFKNKLSLNGVRKRLKDISVEMHLEMRRGSQQEAVDYCKKVNQTPAVEPNEEFFREGLLLPDREPVLTWIVYTRIY